MDIGHLIVNSAVNCTDRNKAFHCIFYCQLYKWAPEALLYISLCIQSSVEHINMGHFIVYSTVNYTDGLSIFHCTFSCQLNRWTYDISLYIQLSIEQMDI